VTTPPLRRPRSWDGEGEVLGLVPLLRGEGREGYGDHSPLKRPKEEVTHGGRDTMSEESRAFGEDIVLVGLR